MAFFEQAKEGDLFLRIGQITVQGSGSATPVYAPYLPYRIGKLEIIDQTTCHR